MSVGIRFVFVTLILSTCATVASAAAPAAAPARPAAQPSAPAPPLSRALLDEYCVACHNDRLKTAGLTLQHIDVTRVADEAEIWEKV
ncbi:MAG: hypothetical protein AB7N65_26095, partial [Vicinamibacterales bacterium]